ncbi:HesB/YadR/YfhF [Plesiocystis pacifica SIR-1]|uniref:HesB/YadR/YfhF n=1 Tax=Plesiocystis pacifica SIR-1 TaxID=391625 RepID=A6G7K6_9BACT|nr:iron-sulfur cluster insertion protein ErpA [Plesiocystis pacifica]EDM78084.1 HesB/YadR/YfhF [Plesiocystis pacifica SIR-1]
MSETSTETSTETNSALADASAGMTMAGPLNMTANAAEKVVEIRQAEDIEDSYALRVKVIGGGCAGFQYDLFFDEQAEGDNVFESNNVKLVCDQMSFMYLMGTTIDYVEGLQGAGFKFENPNTTGSCGCGSSFSV